MLLLVIVYNTTAENILQQYVLSYDENNTTATVVHARCIGKKKNYKSLLLVNRFESKTIDGLKIVSV